MMPLNGIAPNHPYSRPDVESVAGCLGEAAALIVISSQRLPRPIANDGHTQSSHKNPFWDNPFSGLLSRSAHSRRPQVTSTYSDSYQLLLKHLFDARKKAGLTQTMLSERLSKPQSFVSKYERGERRLDVIEFLRGVPTTWG
ncbi:helix-turn-helix domain-containing protein [Pseudomonas sp. S2_A02]